MNETNGRSDIDAKLDDALDDSFPASDPPSIVRSPRPAESAPSAAQDEQSRAKKRAQSDALDEALEESFPASDPPANVQP